MRALLCALCALCAAVPATLKDTVLTNTLDHGMTHGGSTGANTSTAAASPECALYPGLSSTWGEIGAHHPPGCRLVALPELRSQACAAVRFGSCVLDGRAARPCAECARPHQPDVVRASAPAPTTKRQEPLHLIVLSMPYSGSSALAGLFASSPEVATLCAANSHCEPTEPSSGRASFERRSAGGRPPNRWRIGAPPSARSKAIGTTRRDPSGW